MLLRAVKTEDRPALEALLSDESLMHWLLNYPNGQPNLDRWLAKRTGNPEMFFRVVSGRTGGFGGFVQLASIHHKGGFAWLGMAITPQERGAGLGSAALEELCTYARASMNLRKMLLEVLADNAPAIALYRSHRFREIGRMLDHYFDGQKYYDVILMEKALSET